MAEMGECFECEDETEVFCESEISRRYCIKHIKYCVLCGGYCDAYGCENDEGDIDFNIHDCIIDGLITCHDETKTQCKYRYCLSCTKKCPKCELNIILKNKPICSECK